MKYIILLEDVELWERSSTGVKMMRLLNSPFIEIGLLLPVATSVLGPARVEKKNYIMELVVNKIEHKPVLNLTQMVCTGKLYLVV